VPYLPVPPSGPSERDGTCDRSRAGPDGMAVIAALHDPFAVFVTDDLADMVTPYHDGTDRRTARVRSVASPGSRQIVGRTGISANLPTHIPSAPGPRPAAAAVVAGSSCILVTMRGRIPVMVPRSKMVVVPGGVMVMVVVGVP
jgi:hypothetical protein